jgi:hypothetical protein
VVEVISMAEVGLVRFARVAREVAETVLPTYRSKYSKHLFTQPSLLAILCLMRYEDWTFREAEVRLGEHQEPRAALGLVRVPDYRTLPILTAQIPTLYLRSCRWTSKRFDPPPIAFDTSERRAASESRPRRSQRRRNRGPVLQLATPSPEQRIRAVLDANPQLSVHLQR